MKQKGNRKTRTGIVVSDKMDKTVVVQVDTMVQHPQFKKYMTRRTRYKAHDPQNLCNTGDRVMIEETRPISKDKNWRVKTIIEKAPTN